MIVAKGNISFFFSTITERINFTNTKEKKFREPAGSQAKEPGNNAESNTRLRRKGRNNTATDCED